MRSTLVLFMITLEICEISITKNKPSVNALYVRNPIQRKFSLYIPTIRRQLQLQKYNNFLK